MKIKGEFTGSNKHDIMKLGSWLGEKRKKYGIPFSVSPSQHSRNFSAKWKQVLPIQERVSEF